MALCIPIHLRQRTSHVYQDHPTISDRVLTSLVPPVHNQGVSSAPLQGHALWKIFLPTTGSFFVCFITDFFLQQHFSMDVFLLHSVYSAIVADPIALIFALIVQTSYKLLCFLINLCNHCVFRSYNILQHLLTIIITSVGQNLVENPD